jgi:(E)-4-hydroxy-3-methylbut-2-enyl-diphosphate synthase
MGCVVNGPGEAEGADVACCCGRTRAAIYRRGVRRRSVALDSIVPALVEEVRTFLRE